MALYDGLHRITTDQVIEKMKYFIHYAREGMKIHESDPIKAVDMAKELRNKLTEEYKNNKLNRISRLYRDDLNFSNYSAAVHESIASITGPTTRRNVFSFLYDVDDYMGYYMPK